MKTVFIFDMDGTLTDARRPIDIDFHEFMLDFICKHHCVIVTGSDRPKTLEQLGLTLTNTFHRTYHCSGNHAFIGAREEYRNTWKMSREHHKFLVEKINTSNAPEKTGNHIEQRVGNVNFSIVGRNASWDQRKRFAEWDKIHQERTLAAITFNETFDDVVAQVGGETSIDIFPQGHDKSQILKQYRDSRTIFFGDKCMPDGNDYSISQECTHAHQIDDGYRQTWNILREQYSG